MRGGGIRSALGGLVLVGCSAAPADPSPAASIPSSSSNPVVTAAATATATFSPTRSPAIPIPATGTPYDAPAVRAAMRDSRRPGGVPDQLETDAVATRLAAAIWTYDGRPYPLLVIGGSCGPSSCTVEVSGAPAGAAGSDLYAFSVTLGPGTVELLATDLHGYPSGLDAILDAVVRDALGSQALDGLVLTGATWRLPPATGIFGAAYRSGGEEGSPGLDVVVDLLNVRILESGPP